MKQSYKILILIFFSLNSSFSQIVENKGKKYDSIIKKVNTYIRPYQRIADTLSKDLDGDGLHDYIFIIQTNDVLYPINQNDSSYRDPIITYFSSANTINTYRTILPCFQCGYVTFTKESIENNIQKNNDFTLTYTEIQAGVFIYYHYFFSLIGKDIILNKKIRLVDFEDNCIFREKIALKKTLFNDVDMTKDLFSINSWYDNLPDIKCNSNVKKIKIQKSIIYSQLNQPTKMYLLKNDEVEILEEKDEWLKIRFYGKKIIEGWIKKSDVEMN